MADCKGWGYEGWIVGKYVGIKCIHAFHELTLRREINMLFSFLMR